MPLGGKVPQPLSEADVAERLARAERGWAALIPSGTRAASTFSAADRVGIRLKVWKMNPIMAARTLVTRLSDMADRLLPPNSTVPNAVPGDDAAYRRDSGARRHDGGREPQRVLELRCKVAEDQRRKR